MMPDMPFASAAQRRWMWANHPEMAREWESHTPRGKHLPEHVKEGPENSPAPADPTAGCLEKILSGPDYETIQGVPVFDEHDEHDADGKLVRRFDKKKLQAICDASNARARETGDLSPFGPGHTIDDAPETSQPPPWGFFRNYRVGTFGPQNKLGILADMVIRKDKKAEALTYPRRSIELWTNDNIIDWVALLRRTPDRDLGLLTYSRDRGVFAPGPTKPVYYDRKCKRQAAARLSPVGKLRYSMEANVSDNYQGNGEDKAARKAAKKAKEQKRFERFCRYMKAYEDNRVNYAAGPGMPGVGSVSIPSDNVVKRHAKEPITPAPDFSTDKAKLEKEAELIRYQRMEEQVAQLRSEANRANCLSIIRGLLYEGCELDAPSELETLARLDEKGREERVNYIRRYHRKDPAAGREFVRLSDQGISDVRERTTEQRDRAVAYATKHGVGYDAALKATMNEE